MRHRVRVEDPHPHSMAARVLLVRKLQEQERATWVAFREAHLNKAMAEVGDLVCYYCKATGLVPEVPDDATKAQMRKLATLDHVIPKSRGGPELDPKNIVIACYPCNQKKGDKVLGK